ncbi:unnamed protein product, partial [Polarella glacialis]
QQQQQQQQQQHQQQQQQRSGGALMRPDYEAAEDSRFATPGSNVIDVSGGPVDYSRESGRDWPDSRADSDPSKAPWGLAGDEEVDTDHEDEDDDEQEVDSWPPRSGRSSGRRSDRAEKS